jgi:dihydrofolate synthase/folylpolyglutamate synthase
VLAINYEEALKYIESTVKFGSKLGLANITELLRRLGNPQNNYPSVHVAGTNGKGSVTAMTASILREGGYRVGMFISPYLERFTERIQINSEEIPQESVAALIDEIRMHVEEMVHDGYNHPTFFEVITALGFLWFARQNVDIAVVEVGLGGRLDATNVINPLVSVITSISYDHTKVLGHSLEEIAYEKGGIIKPGVPVVSYPQKEEAGLVLERLAAKRGCQYYPISPEQITVRYDTFSTQNFDFTFLGKTMRNLTIHLSGKHQLLNAACSLACICLLKDKGFPIEERDIYTGLEKAKWPGRMEMISKDPVIILDGAHNLSGAQVLADAVRHYFPDSKLYLVFGMLRDKDVEGVSGILCPLADRVMVTMPHSPRSMAAEQLREIVQKYNTDIYVQPDLTKALHSVLKWLREEKNEHEDQCEKKVMLISGSLYLIGEARTILREMLDLNI